MMTITSSELHEVMEIFIEKIANVGENHHFVK